MAKAVFHKHQRVFVGPVGTWALVEQVKPQWVKDVEEPLRVTYDVGLGREFAPTELSSEDTVRGRARMEEDPTAEHWRVQRAKNRWQDSDEVASHPHPGTFPVVITDENDWGGWRVPGAEYDRDPNRIEYQARLIANAPQLLLMVRRMAEYAARHPGEVSDEIKSILQPARQVLRHVYDVAGTPSKGG